MMLTKAILLKKLLALGVACTVGVGMGATGVEPAKRLIRRAIHKPAQPTRRATTAHTVPIVPACAPAPGALPTDVFFPSQPLPFSDTSQGHISGGAPGLVGGGSGGGGGGSTGVTPRPPTAVPPSLVPEPGTWMMMVAGFGLVGVSARRRGPVMGLSR